MKYPFIPKASVAAVLLSVAALSVQAQKIEDQELKINVSELQNPLKQLTNLEPIRFSYDVNKYKHLKLPSGNQFGFRSAELKAAFPDMVKETSLVYISGKNNSAVARYDEVQMQQLIPVLVSAIKEQQAEIDLLKKELSQLKENAK